MDYTELSKLSEDELKAIAKRFNIDLRLKRDDMIAKIEEADIRRKIEIETRARAEVEVDARKKIEEEQKKLGMDKPVKSSPETIAIEDSKKVYAVFNNLDSPKAERKFFWGDKYHFHLFPGKVHVVPMALIKHMETECLNPVFEDSVNSTTGEKISVLSKKKEKRFLFDVIGDAPKDSPFGVVLDSSVLSELKEVKYA